MQRFLLLFSALFIFLAVVINQLYLLYCALSPFLFKRRDLSANSVKIHHSTPERIPRVIHQIWKSQNLSTYPLPASRGNWISECDGWDVKLWDDEMILTLIGEYFPWLEHLYKSYPFNIQRADIARLIILYAEGGEDYLCIDVVGCR
jgi:mannosyltransferase OCH1-like enzyme